MSENKKSNETSLYIRTSEEVKARFNDMITGGATQTERFEYLMNIYDEMVKNEEYINVKPEIDSIENKLQSIVAEIGEIKNKADKWQVRAKEVYINGVGAEFKALKDTIEFDKELKDTVEDLKKQLEKQKSENAKLREINGEFDTKVRELENKNAELIDKNNDAITRVNEVKDQAIADTKKVIELEARLEIKTEQYENANRELSELREYKFKYEDVARELAEIKNSKDNKLKAKNDEIEKLKAELKELKSAKVETKTKKDTTK